MKSRKLVQLRRCNNQLKSSSWINFQKFLGILLRSTRHKEADSLLRFYEAKDWTGLVRDADRISSTVYGTAADHRLCNQLAAVIRKYPFPTGSVTFDPEGEATKKFLASEHKCKRVNKRFALYESLRSPHEYALNQARSWISYVLGDLSLSDIWDGCDFGPGASMGVHGSATNSARKLLSQNWSVSPSAFYYGYASLVQDVHIRELISINTGSPYYSFDNDVFMSAYRRKVTFVDNNKIVFVPKTAKVHRTIAVEPLINGFVQKGVDSFMRKRLKRVGIDLNDQSRNQRLAFEGSRGTDLDPYVTIDLSSASDSISIGLCRYMLPSEWFEFLKSLRSRDYLLGKSLRTYHKFTTMGNGFCFPLETLLFASLCQVAYNESGLSPDYSVYGDDIIVRQSVCQRVLDLLSICGFSINPDKTFLSGPFRESCGADWFEGEDVRPLSLDYAFDSIQNVFKFCNLAASKGAWECIFYECLEFLKSLIPKELYFTRPHKGNVDTALEVPLQEFLLSPFSKWHRKMQCWSWIEIRSSAWPDNPVKSVTGYNVALMRGALTGSTSPVPFAERRKSRTKVCRISRSAGWSLFLPYWATDRQLL